MSRTPARLGVCSCILVASLSVMAAHSAEPAKESGAKYLSAAEQRTAVAKTKDGLVSSRIPTGASGPVVLLVRRDAAGEVEVHDALDDVFVVQQGKATVLVGGRVEGNKQTAAGEWRGGKIVGAQSYTLGVGDVLWIPAGLPHQVLVDKDGSFTYLAFKSAR